MGKQFINKKRDKTSFFLFYLAFSGKTIMSYRFFSDWMTGMSTNAAEMSIIRMTGPSIRSLYTST